MRKFGEACLGATVFFASSHPSESCGSNGLPLTPNSIKILGRFQILKTIDHPHLCKYVDIVRGKHERLIVVAEHYKTNLRDLYKNERPKDFVNTSQIAFEVLQGLSHLNTFCTVHRCLGPRNILFSSEGRVKLTKYGMYHMTDGGTCVSFPIGVPKYMAPEVLAVGPVVVRDHVTPPSPSPCGPKVDVWSLGLILLECVLGIELWNNFPLEQLFPRLFSIITSGSSGLALIEEIAAEHNCSNVLNQIPADIKDLIASCLTLNPRKRPRPDELVNLPLFAEFLENFSLVDYKRFAFPSAELRCLNMEVPNPDDPLDDDHLGQRSIEEVYYLWQLAGGDLDSELKKQGILKSMPPVCTLPKVVVTEGEFFGQKKDRAFLLDETFVVLPLDQLKQRLSRIEPEAFYPLLEDSTKTVGTPDNTIAMETASLPLIIREKDFEYQFHRIILYERLLKGYPFKRPHIIKEAKLDIPPLYRAHIWASLLDINGDVQGKYDSIDKETPTLTDRQIEVDIPRCHQYDELLSSPEGHAKFKRLLKAWVVSHPQYVYWQGLDSLCAPFLYLNFNDEALASSCMSAFISKYLHKFFLKDNSAVIQEYLAVFSHLIAFHDPELTNHLNSIGFIPELYSIPWFLTMYTHVFPLHKIFHLWDTLLLGNASFPLFIGVAILKQLRDSLISFGFNECILLFSDMPEIDIEACVADSITLFCSTPKSAAYRQFEKPMPERSKRISTLSNPDGAKRINPDLEMDPIPLQMLKSQLSPRMSAADLLDLLNFKGLPGSPSSKPKLLVIDVRCPDEFLRGAIPDSVNIPFQTAFSPEGTLNPCPEVTKLNSCRGRLLVVVGKRGQNAVNFADLLIKLGYQRVCTLHKGIDVLRSTGILVVPAAEVN